MKKERIFKIKPLKWQKGEVWNDIISIYFASCGFENWTIYEQPSGFSWKMRGSKKFPCNSIKHGKQLCRNHYGKLMKPCLVEVPK